jgi:TIR domain
LSYRRDDASGHAGRLYDQLAGRYGAERVFIDIDAVPLGSEFGEAIRRAVASCDVLIVLIGRGWLRATDSDGHRRLDDPDDFVRSEIESALAQGVVVVPACVQGAEIPRAQELPPSLAPLTRRQGIQLSDTGWQDDVGRLIRRLEAGVMPEALTRSPEPERAPAERRSKVFPIALGGSLLLAVIAGIALGGSGGGAGEDEAGRAPVTPAAAGAMQLRVPAGYAKMSSAPALPGLDLVESASYAPGGKDGGRAVTFGQPDANNPTLLPAQFRKAVRLAGGEVPDRAAVKLGPDGLQGYRYEGLAPAGISRRVTVYASPTSEGVATVACLAPPADAGAFKRECEGIANTLRIASGKPFPVGPDPGYAKVLGATLGRLDGQVANGRKALARDKTTFKAQAARDIQSAYVAAAKRLRDTTTSPADTRINMALAEGLGAAARAWERAASAAAKKDKRGFAAAGTAIRKRQAELARTLARLEAVGYKIAK